ncbi:MAG TPA: hypothetical protein VG738_03525 [Chitinophagaceae bacterium]|nr:hypothetical protein [Chitinophagaceae bacterium]
MFTKKLFAILLFAGPLLLHAQKPGNNLHWFNVTQWGWLMGKNEQTNSIETINGVSYKKYNAGIGVAFDNYGYHSLPVFADLRYSLVNGRKNILQVYGDAGLNIPLHSDYLKYRYPDNGDVWHQMHISFYGETGISYAYVLGRKFCLIAGAGYNYKTFKYSEYTYVGELQVTRYTTDYTYHYSKYVLRLGVGLR